MDFQSLLEKIVQWNPDYIVPVGRKAGKIFRMGLPPQFYNRVFYKEYFDFTHSDPKSKKVAVVDDSIRYASSLREHRDYFERKGADVKTYAFVAHLGLKDGSHVCYDREVIIPEHNYLSEPAYEDYVRLESEYLIENGFYQDLNHLIVEVALNFQGNGKSSVERLLRNSGYVYDVAPYDVGLGRFSIDRPDFFTRRSKLLPGARFVDGINKVRFHVTLDRIVFVPMVLPRVKTSNLCPIPQLGTPFELPCAYLRGPSHKVDELCYWSFSLLLSAEMGRTLVTFLKSNVFEEPALVEAVKRLSVKDLDFVRYLGVAPGRKLASDIQEFMLRDNYAPGKALVDGLANFLIHDGEVIGRSFSNQSIVKILEYLRSGYEEACRKAGTRVGIHFARPLKDLQRVSDAHHLVCMEMLDWLCDLGVLVPVIDSSANSIERMWRAGEVEIPEWVRTTYLVPLAIRVASDELQSGKPIAHATLLEKMLANFAYDYPPDVPLHRPLHCLRRDEDMEGTTVSAQHALRAPKKVSIYNSRGLGGRYSFNKPPGQRSYFECNPNSLKGLEKYFGDDTKVTISELIAYFSFLAAVSKKYGAVDALTSLSICRNPDVFLNHAKHNFALWFQYFGEFLDNCGPPYSEDKRKGPLHKSGEAANAGLAKIEYWKGFGKFFQEVRNEFTDMRFMTPVRRISLNIESKSLEPAVLEEIERIFRIMNAFTGAVLARVLPDHLHRKQDEVVGWALGEFERCGFRHDFEHMLVATHDEFLNLVRPAYDELFRLVQKLPKSVLESEARRQAEYAKIAENKAVAIVKEKGWVSACFTYVDLSGFRQAGPDAAGMISDMYDKSNEIAVEFGGFCANPEPSGNDFLLFVTDDVLRCLRMSSACMAEYEKIRIPIKMGLARAEAAPGTLYDSLVPAMGLARDLCEYEDPAIKYRNYKEVLISESFVQLAKDQGISDRYFVEVLGTSVPEGKGKVTVRLFKFDWKHFMGDKR
jgi:hypothetical protein